MAAAGAKAGGSAATAGGAKYTIKSLGTRPARSGRRAVAVAAAVALLAVGGAAFASLSRPVGHAGRAGAAPSSAPARPGAVAAAPAPAKSRAAPAPARTRAVAAPAHRVSAVSPARRGPAPAVSLEVVGVGCPGRGGGTVILGNPPRGPGWIPAGGGWTGDGCDGSTLWTMDPNRKQPVPSTLSWNFSPTPWALRCTLAVFVPTQNALGVSEYSVSNGPLAAGQVVAVIPVNQAAEAGHWLTLGTFPVSGSPPEITAAPVPGASGPGHHGAIAASAASARCT